MSGPVELPHADPSTATGAPAEAHTKASHPCEAVAVPDPSFEDCIEDDAQPAASTHTAAVSHALAWGAEAGIKGRDAPLVHV